MAGAEKPRLFAFLGPLFRPPHTINQSERETFVVKKERKVTALLFCGHIPRLFRMGPLVGKIIE